MRLIDADALKSRFKRFGLGEHSLTERFFADGVYAVIDNAPTVDAVPVVRCGQCNRFESCELGRLWLGADGFCSYGERRNDD